MFRNEILEAYGNGMIEQDAMGQLACDNQHCERRWS